LEGKDATKKRRGKQWEQKGGTKRDRGFQTRREGDKGKVRFRSTSGEILIDQTVRGRRT